MNQNFYEPNLCYNSISSGFDQFQPPQFPIVYQPPQEETSVKILQDRENDCHIVYYDDDDDEDYTIAITPVLSTEEPVDSLIMEDEHLDTISTTELDEVIKSSVEDLVPIQSESEGNPDNMCDASPPDFELVSLEEVKDFDPEDGEIDTDFLLTIKDDILREKLLNINLLIAKIKALKDNPTPSTDSVLKSPSSFPNSFLEKTDTSDNSLPESNIFYFDLEEKRSCNPTSYSDLSLLNYEALFCNSEPDSGDFTMDVVEDIFDNPTRELRVHAPNGLPTHPSFHLDSGFTLFSDSLGPDLVVSFPSGTRNKIFDPGIFFEVQSKNFLSRDTFYISFIHDPLCLVIETLLLFLSKMKNKFSILTKMKGCDELAWRTRLFDGYDYAFEALSQQTQQAQEVQLKPLYSAINRELITTVEMI
nr:hypothetical protein [Tanacetum cinerariifolium]